MAGRVGARPARAGTRGAAPASRWAGVVDGFRRLRPRRDADLELTPPAGALRPLFPDRADRLPPLLEALGDPEETRHRILSALTELLGHWVVGVLVVEDAHGADTTTPEWLLGLTASARTDLFDRPRPRVGGGGIVDGVTDFATVPTTAA